MGFPASGKCAAPIRVCRRLAKQRKESNGACKDGRGFREEEISIRPCGVADKVGRRTLSPGNRTSQHPKTHRGWQRLSLDGAATANQERFLPHLHTLSVSRDHLPVTHYNHSPDSGSTDGVGAGGKTGPRPLCCGCVSLRPLIPQADALS